MTFTPIPKDVGGGSWPGRLDNLIHHPRLAWLPRFLTSWVCDWMDHKLGMTWGEIRRARHGKLRGYTNQLDDWRTITNTAASGTASNTIPGTVIHYKYNKNYETGETGETGEKP